MYLMFEDRKSGMVYALYVPVDVMPDISAIYAHDLYSEIEDVEVSLAIMTDLLKEDVAVEDMTIDEVRELVMMSKALNNIYTDRFIVDGAGLYWKLAISGLIMCFRNNVFGIEVYAIQDYELKDVIEKYVESGNVVVSIREGIIYGGSKNE